MLLRPARSCRPRESLPDGTTISTEQPDAARILSAALKREVRLEKIERAGASNQETSEEYWLDMEGLEHRHRHRFQPA